MDIEHVREFVRIANEGSFSRAAVALNVTQPALSKHMAALERELGCELLARSNVRTTLTPAGHVFYADATTLLADHDAARAHLAEFAHSVRMHLTIESFHGYRPSDDLLAALRADFRRERRNVELVAHDITLASPYDDLREGVSDLCLVDDLLDDPEIDFAGIETLDLLTDSFVAIVREDHPLASRDEIWMREIGGDVVWTTGTPGVRQYFSSMEKVLERHGAKPHFAQFPWTCARDLYDSFAFFEGGIHVNLASVVKYSAPFAFTGYKVLRFKDEDADLPVRAHWLSGAANPAVPLALEALKAAVARMGEGAYRM